MVGRGTVTTMTCTLLTDPLRRLLNRLADTTGAPNDTLAASTRCAASAGSTSTRVGWR